MGRRGCDAPMRTAADPYRRPAGSPSTRLPIWGRQGRVIDNWRAAEVALFSAGLIRPRSLPTWPSGPAGSCSWSCFMTCRGNHTRKRYTGKSQKSARGPCADRIASPDNTTAGRWSYEQVTRPAARQTAVYLALLTARPGAVARKRPTGRQPPADPEPSSGLFTRSAHPRTLNLLNQLITALGGGVTVMNPLKDLTKGEVCDLALEAGLTGDAVLQGPLQPSAPQPQPSASFPLRLLLCLPGPALGAMARAGRRRRRLPARPLAIAQRGPKSRRPASTPALAEHSAEQQRSNFRPPLSSSNFFPLTSCPCSIALGQNSP